MAKKTRGTVGEALQSVLGGMESATRVRESLALAYWKRVVGPQAAAASEPDSVRDGVLFVRTRSAVWSQELTFLKAHIIGELNKQIGRPVIKEIVFRAQGVENPASEAEEPSLPTEEDLALIRLLPEENTALREELDALVSIPDERIRQSVARRLIRDRKIRRWRLEHGWRACMGCDALHRTDGDLCPICRLCR